LKKIAILLPLILLCGFMADSANDSETDLCQKSLSPQAGITNAPQLISSPADKDMILAKAAAITIPFVKNAGQFASEVTYAADLFARKMRDFICDTAIDSRGYKRENSLNGEA